MRIVMLILSLAFCLIFTTRCDQWITGSDKTGYRFEIESDLIDYSYIRKIEIMLNEEGFHPTKYQTEEGNIVEWKERAVSYPRYPGEVYTLLTKIFTNENEDVIDAYLSYVKDTNSEIVHNPKIMIENWFRGGIVPEIRKEIDRIGELIYQTLLKNVGEEKITIRRFGNQ